MWAVISGTGTEANPIPAAFVAALEPFGVVTAHLIMVLTGSLLAAAFVAAAIRYRGRYAAAVTVAFVLGGTLKLLAAVNNIAVTLGYPALS